MALDTGARLGAYEITAKIGAGGMGEVYRARDTRLDRSVALKVLPPEQAGDPDRTARFLQEARAASALNHPNVAHIYEIGESEGLRFIAMEFVEGETLAARVAGRPLSTDEILDIATQAAGALEEAHSKRIVHRDIKPANIMITPRGQVKVLDFGLAKVASGPAAETVTAITHPGMVMGTVPYMSPEQVLGRQLDARSDIFSLGAVLYEMTTGRMPFAGKTVAETMHSVTHAQPEAIARFNYDAPPELERVIRKCLEKDPDRRYQSARELEVDLRNLKRDSQSLAAAPPRRRSRVWLAAGVLVSLLLLSAGGLYFARGRGAIDSVAVLPFANASNNSELEYLSDGLTEQLINGLTQLPGLKVMARTTAFSYKGKQVDPKQVGAELHVRAVLTGRVAQRGDSLVVQADLVDAHDGSELWGKQYTGKPAEIQAVQEEITREVAGKLKAKVSETEEARLARRQNPESYRLYLQGRYAMSDPSEDHIRLALQYYQQALAKDPNDALALAGMADAFSYLGDLGTSPPKEVMGQAKAAAQKALAIDETVAEAHASLGIVSLLFEWDWPVAEKEFRRALELNPGNAYDHHWYAHYLDSRGRFDEGLAEMSKAIELDPLSEMFNFDHGFQLALQHRPDEALAQFRRVQQINPANPFAQFGIAFALERAGKREEALAALQKTEIAPSAVLWSAVGSIYARLGKMEEARKLLAKMMEQAKKSYVPAMETGMLCFAVGEKGQGFSYLERAYEERSSGFTYLLPDPSFDSVRADPRFAAVVKKVGMPPPVWQAR